MAEGGIEGQQPPESDQLKAPFDANKPIADVKAEISEDELRRKEEHHKRIAVIVEFLNETEQDSELDSPRFQAFCDYVDVTLADGMGEPKTLKQALIQETIRQRRNGVLGYDDQWDEVVKKEKEYENNFKDKRRINNLPFEELLLMYTMGDFKEIKEQEIKKRNQQYKKPPQQLETPKGFNPTATPPSEPPTQK